MGNFQGFKRLTGRHVYVDGYNGVVGNAYEDLWDYSTVWTPIAATGVKLEVCSSDADDDAADTGAITLRVGGLDIDCKWQEEDFTLNGQAAVAGAKTFYRVLAAEVLTAGTTGSNEGVLYVADALATWAGGGTPVEPALVQATIPIGNNRTMLGRFTAPAGRAYFLKDITLGCNTQAVVMKVELREYGDIWKCMGYYSLAATTNAIHIPFKENFLEVPPKADFRFNVTCPATGGVAMGIAHLEMV
jgi:hypothetical protein